MYKKCGIITLIKSSIFLTRYTHLFLFNLEDIKPTPKNSLIKCKIVISFICRLISKLVCTRQFKADLLEIITVKQPSPSVNPVTQFGSSLFGISVLLLKFLINMGLTRPN
jgi:hypothetical protein